MTPFSLRSNIVGQTLVLSTEGYINQDAGEQTAAASQPFIDGGGKSIVLDLKNSKIINSIGISHIIELIENLNSHGGRLMFCNLDRAVEKTLTIMGLFQIAQKVESVDAAISKKSFKLG